ncbi:hypothetical protein L1987_30303 [Smallanthus sonchifolius]|uniref:Uncharacterized protein n=1 Tax=Smallanthus sonchifolius TaxID=185202 RepID=A0ACB9I3M7_9ASTR|nr:hypothetical protein L1987_30303 [Smallanthus sonchifolius]
MEKKGGNAILSSPSQTPRSTDNSTRDLRHVEGNMSGKQCKEKGVNVHVVVRCRPLNADDARLWSSATLTDEEKLHTPVVVTCAENKREIDRSFVFDKVFGPKSQQRDLYHSAVLPIVFEVLEGYNCTIFAYGQTGTGKTYTMEGGGRKKNGEFPSDAELYNEEITDLLAPEEASKFPEDKSKKPALMEDGKGGVLVRGLEEEMVSTADEIYRILEKEGEEVIRCGKLNLVDLAGSENISRSGAKEGRAREAGEINKSLLTLGRVINTLVERSGHIPYRDSKLTRLLRDSLGGKTKTCIIATISPSIHSLEETLSTLDYAHHAKNIKNKPEINQKLMKSAMMKDLYSEIERLKQEVYAAREKNGIYIPKDRYLQEEEEKKAMAEKIERMELDNESRGKELYNSQQLITAILTEKLEKTEIKLQETEHSLFDLEENHNQANVTIKEKEFLISNLLKSEKALLVRAFDLRGELENAASDLSCLFTKIERKDKIEDGNIILVQQFQSQLSKQLNTLHKTIAASVTQQEQQLKGMEEDMKSFVSTKAEGRIGSQSNFACTVFSCCVICTRRHKYSLQLDHDARDNLDSIIVPCCGELRELKGGHYHKITEITENAGKTLLNDYTVDEPSCSTPKKRAFILPSMASIEELQTPSFEELLKQFWDSKSSLKSNGEVKHLKYQSPRDSRLPLAAINS